MSQVLSRAKVALKIAEYCKSNLGEEDAFLDSMCFNIQQALWFALNALMELNGKRYITNHDIRAQLNTLDRLGVSVPHAQELKNMVITINAWEAESKYVDSFLAVVSDVELVMSYTKDIISFAEQFVHTKNNTKALDAFSEKKGE